MDEKILEALGRKAYETHLNIKGEQSERYFKLEYTPWESLPASSRSHWQNIAFSVLRLAEEIDYGDLVS